MPDIERGPAHTYEIVWRSGHIERVLAHQVTWPGQIGTLFGMVATQRTGPQQIHFHAEVDGRWLPTLIADEADIQSIRLVTEPERIPEVT